MNEFDRIKLINLARQITFDKAALTEEEKQFNVLKKAVDAGNLPSEVLIKARSGIYADNPVNRKKGRVGTRYGKKAEGGDTYDLENGGKMGEKKSGGISKEVKRDIIEGKKVQIPITNKAWIKVVKANSGYGDEKEYRVQHIFNSGETAGKLFQEKTPEKAIKRAEKILKDQI